MVFTIASFGINRGVSPWTVGVADSTGTFQPFLNLPATGGGPYIPLAAGGLGTAGLTANVGGIFYSTASAAAILVGTATARQMLQSGASAAPAWSTATWPATTTINQLLFSSAANTIAGLATANSGVLSTSSAGVPSITPTPTLGVNGGTGGSLTLNGSTSGAATIGVAAAAGAVAFNLPPTNGATTNVLVTDGSGNTSWAAMPNAYASFFEGYIGGLTLSNDGVAPNTVIDIAAGVAVDSTNSVFIKIGAFTKYTAGSWMSGSGANGMGTGLTIANATWYHVFAIINAGSSDIYFDTSVTGANAPAGTTAFRRIGAFVTDSSAHILAFSQNGDEFLLAVPAAIATTTLGATPTLFAMAVPLGLKINALIRAFSTNAATNTVVLLSSPDETSGAANSPVGNISLASNGTGSSTAAFFNIRTNASQQIRAVSSNANQTLDIASYGWIDTRGRFS